MNKNNSIIYVNYFPYENAGKILDFLTQNFKYVFLFVFGFHKINKKNPTNKLCIYKDNRLIKEINFFQTKFDKKYLFILLPIKSVINFIQLIFYSFWIFKKYGKVKYFFTVNAFTAWIGLFIKNLGFAEKTIFWVWDYYPPIHSNKIISLMRQIYWQFDRISSFSDRVYFVSKRLAILRQELGVIPQSEKYKVVGLGTDKISTNSKNPHKIVLGFLGTLKKDQGLNFIFDIANLLKQNFPKLKLSIVGSGPDEEYFKFLANKSKLKCDFYGYISDLDPNYKKILKTFSIGIAPYVSDPSSVSHYGDPAKIKLYLSLGIPIITTGIFESAKNLSKAGAGEIVDLNKSQTIITAINKIIKKYDFYSKNSQKLREKYYYKLNYVKMFS